MVVVPCGPLSATRSSAGVCVRAGAGVVVDAGADVGRDAGAVTDVARPCVTAAGASGLAPVRRPMVTCTYPMPSGAAGQSILTQLPRLRETGRTAPRETWPMTGVTVLGPL